MTGVYDQDIPSISKFIEMILRLSINWSTWKQKFVLHLIWFHFFVIFLFAEICFKILPIPGLDNYVSYIVLETLESLLASPIANLCLTLYSFLHFGKFLKHYLLAVTIIWTCSFPSCFFLLEWALEHLIVLKPLLLRFWCN